MQTSGSDQGVIVVPQDGGISGSSAQQVKHQVNRPRDILTSINEVTQEDQGTIIPLWDCIEPGDQSLQLITLPVQVSDGDDRVVQARRQGHPEDSGLRFLAEHLVNVVQKNSVRPLETGSNFLFLHILQ